MALVAPFPVRSSSLHKVAFVVLILVLMGILGSGTAHADPGRAKWVIMIYMDADNNLEYASLFSMNRLERIGSNDDVKIVVQWDRNPGYDKSNGNWSGTKRFLILRDDDEEEVSSPELEDLGEVDMGRASSLTEFINWTREKYPADRYALVMWNHGGGWMLHTADDTSKSYLTIPSLSRSLKTAGLEGDLRLDLLIFDECLMGLTDLAYEMVPYAKVMVASEDVVPGTGIDYTDPLSELKDNPGMDEKQLSRAIVRAYESFYSRERLKPFVTLAAYDLQKIRDVADATYTLSAALGGSLDQKWPQIGMSVGFSEAFTRSEGLSQFKREWNYYDLYDFADLLERGDLGEEVKGASRELKASLEGAVIAEYHGNEHPFAHGLTIYFPEDERLFNENYTRASEFSRVTGWGEFLRGYIAAETTDTIAPAIEIDAISPGTSNITNPP